MHTGHLFEHFNALLRFEILDYFPMVDTYQLVNNHVINQQIKNSF